jgi:hypothetical protein
MSATVDVVAERRERYSIIMKLTTVLDLTVTFHLKTVDIIWPIFLHFNFTPHGKLQKLFMDVFIY